MARRGKLPAEMFWTASERNEQTKLIVGITGKHEVFFMYPGFRPCMQVNIINISIGIISKNIINFIPGHLLLRRRVRRVEAGLIE